MKGLVKIQLICPNTNKNNIEKASKGIFAYNRSSFNNYLGCEVLKCVFVPFRFKVERCSGPLNSKRYFSVISMSYSYVRLIK